MGLLPRAIGRRSLLAQVLDRLDQKLVHLAPQLMVGNVHIARIEIGADLVEHVGVAGLDEVGLQDRLGIGFGFLGCEDYTRSFPWPRLTWLFV